MIIDKPKFKNLKSEGLKRVVEILNNNDKITNKHFNVVDAKEYTHEYFNKGKELDEQININNDLISERITYESNEKEIIKYQKIFYNGEEIRNELIYKRQK
mgnify:FL=1